MNSQACDRGPQPTRADRGDGVLAVYTASTPSTRPLRHSQAAKALARRDAAAASRLAQEALRDLRLALDDGDARIVSAAAFAAEAARRS